MIYLSILNISRDDKPTTFDIYIAYQSVKITRNHL